MTIRIEEEKDYREVENLTREAFFNVYCPGCSEHYILHKFRNDDSFIKELSLIIENEEKNEIVAHIMYVKAYAIDKNKSRTEVIMFGPVSVLPKYQKQGLGKIIINYSLDKAKDIGFKAVVITGDPNYYQKFGFERAVNFNLFYDLKRKDENFDFFMVKQLEEKSLHFEEAILELPKVYNVDQEELEEFDSTFPYKEKLELNTQIF